MSDTPITDGKISKCLDMLDFEACGEYVALCRKLERELVAVTQYLPEVRKYLRDANRGAEVNAKVNQLLVNELAEVRRQVARAEELLVAAEEWMSADGCDCGTDEIDACSLCRIRAFLAAAQQEKDGVGNE